MIKPNQDIVDYVMESFLIGLPLDTIKRNLAKNRWKKEEINQAVEIVKRKYPAIENKHSIQVGTYDWIALGVIAAVVIGVIVLIVINLDFFRSVFGQIRTKISSLN